MPPEIGEREHEVTTLLPELNVQRCDEGGIVVCRSGNNRLLLYDGMNGRVDVTEEYPEACNDEKGKKNHPHAPGHRSSAPL
jgi:hypothetical protein